MKRADFNLKKGSQCEYCDDWINDGSDHSYHEHCIKEHWDQVVFRILNVKSWDDVPETMPKKHPKYAKEKE